jgi:hypothetical protein
VRQRTHARARAHTYTYTCVRPDGSVEMTVHGGGIRT